MGGTIMHYRDFKKIENKKYYISTNDTLDAGPETMIFEMDGDDIDWTGIYTRRYKNMEIAAEWHKKIISNLEKYIKGDNQ